MRVAHIGPPLEINATRGTKGTDWKVEVEATCLRGTAAQVAESPAMDGRAGRSGAERIEPRTAVIKLLKMVLTRHSRVACRKSGHGRPGGFDSSARRRNARADPHPNPSPGGRGAHPRHSSESWNPF